MTVKELIERLQGYDGDLVVSVMHELQDGSAEVLRSGLPVGTVVKLKAEIVEVGE